MKIYKISYFFAWQSSILNTSVITHLFWKLNLYSSPERSDQQAGHSFYEVITELVILNRVVTGFVIMIP